MSLWFWRGLNTVAGVILFFVLLGVIVFSANLEIKDLDLWFHLGCGKYIVEHASIPTTDIFSATMAGKPWVNHEWLFQVIVYTAYRFGGMDGVIFLTVILVSMIFILLYFLTRGLYRDVFQVVLLFIVLLVFQHRMMLRPDMFSILFLIIYTMFLAFWMERPFALGVLFIVQVLWTNSHGFFILGPFLVALALGTELLKRCVTLPFDWGSVGRVSDDECRQLKRLMVVVTAACFINPAFAKGALYPLQVLFSLSGDSKTFFSHIGELSRPLSLQNLFSWGDYPGYNALIILSTISFFFDFRRIDISVLAFWGAAFLFSLSASRNIVFFAVVSYIAIFCNLANFYWTKILPPVFNKENRRFFFGIVVKIVMVFVLLNYVKALTLNGYFDFDRFTRKSEYGGVSLRNFPYKAVDFLVDNKIRGAFWNDFNSGAYLIGRTSPDIRVFIDGRTELYGGKFFDEYRKMGQGDQRLLENALQRYQLTGAFLGSVHSPAPKEIVSYFYHHPDWVPVYFDYDALIFLKNIPQNKSAIDRLRVDLSSWKPRAIDLQKYKMKNVIPYQHMTRAVTLFNMGLIDQAESEAKEAMKLDPRYALPFKLLGEIALYRKDYVLALEYLRKAVFLDQENIWARYYLAESFYFLKEWDAAQQQAGRVLKEDPQNDKAKILSALTSAAQGRTEEVFWVMETFGRSGEFTAGIGEIGSIFVSRNDFDNAIKVFHFGVDHSDNPDVFYERLSKTYEQMGMMEEAKKFNQQAREADRD